MTESDTKLNFLRQSSWLVSCNVISGIFLVCVYPVIAKMPTAELGVFTSLLRLFTILGIPAAGLQLILAQEAAAAVSKEGDVRVANVACNIARGIVLLWLVMTIPCLVFQDVVIRILKVKGPVEVWITMGLVLAALFLPFFQGLLQGKQNFFWLGWSTMLHGVGRFTGIFLIVSVFKATAVGALAGALLGLCSSLAAGFWPLRRLRPGPNSNFAWVSWLKRAFPLTCGVGSSLFIINADILFVQSHFSEEIAPLYSAVAMLGVGLVTLTTPLGAVMFPKLVRSVAQAQRSTSLSLALCGTLLLGGSAALVCTIAPSLPLRILYFNRPELWISSELVPFFMWCLLPVSLANILIGGLLAKKDFRAVPWLIAVAVGYGCSLFFYLQSTSRLEHFAAFKGVILRLGFFSLLLLAVASTFTLLRRRDALVSNNCPLIGQSAA